MIIRRGSDAVAEWLFLARQLQSPPEVGPEVYRWVITQIPVVVSILAAERLLEPSKVSIELAQTRAAEAPARIDVPVHGLPGVPEAINRFRRAWPREVPIWIEVTGSGLVAAPAGDRVLQDVVSLRCSSLDTEGAVAIETWCDAWLPRSLRAEHQPEVRALNAPRLRSALVSVERALGVAGRCVARTKFAVCEGYVPDNRTSDDGAPLDLEDLGFDESWIAVE